MVKRRKSVSFLKLFLFVLVLCVFYFLREDISRGFSQISAEVEDYGSILGSGVIFGKNEVLTDFGVTFCPSQACLDVFLSEVSKAKSEVLCAFYEFDNVVLVDRLSEVAIRGVKVEVVTDFSYIGEEAVSMLKDVGVPVFSDEKRGTRYDNYMHDKFCVIDNGTIVMGSANPTDNDFLYNNNNVLVFGSKFLAQNYRNEFLQMKSGVFGYNKKSVLRYQNLSFVYGNESLEVSNYFCPQDECLDAVLEVLSKAKSEILFAAFSLTQESIENLLILKNEEGVVVKGVIENRMWNVAGSDAENLSLVFNVSKDKNPRTMHHKFFVVDGRFVVTGSMNPTSAGVNYNDENLVIIDSPKIAEMYRNEFFGLFS